jgi:hypothetical protein
LTLRGRVLLGILAGALLRAILLPLPGTGDVLIWKVWSANAATDLTGVYGVGGVPPERRVLHWHSEDMTVDYPPLALDELAIAGRAYLIISPAFDDTRWLNVFVKLPGLAAEIALLVLLLTWGRRLFGRDEATWTALALWLNPLVLLDGAALGYLDAPMAVPLVLAVMTAWTGRAALTGLLVAAAILTKAQAVFAVPAIAMILYWRTERVRALAASTAAGAAVSAALLLPFIVRGAWTNLVQALGRLATHDMLSAQAANIWWIFTWVLRVIDVWTEWGGGRAMTQEVRILAISRADALGYPNARVVGLVLVILAISWACWRVRRNVTLAQAAAITGWCAYAYAMLAAQVHENHWYAAVPLFGLAAGANRRYRTVFWAVTAVAALNLYLFYGLGDGWPPITSRAWTGIDMTVVLSVVNVGVFAYAGRLIAVERRALTRLRDASA